MAIIGLRKAVDKKQISGSAFVDWQSNLKLEYI